IPTDAFKGVQFTVPVYEWARRVPWSKFDRKDDQTQSLYQVAREAGESAALLPERFFFDLITNSAVTMPAVPLAPDGAAMFATTNGGGTARFGATNGNLLSGNGIASVSAILTDYYRSIVQFKLFQDGKGQPLFRDNYVDNGFIIIHAAADTDAFQEAFLQNRLGIVLVTDSGTTL